MGDWQRVTRECTVDELLPEIDAAIGKHVEQHNLGLDLASTWLCIETTSDKIKKGLFRGDRSVITTALLLPGWLIWAIRGDRQGVAVMSARLGDIVVQDYAGTKFASMVPDSGVDVSGSFTDVPERGSAFIGLDEGAVAKRFKDSLIQAVQDAKR